MGNYALQTITTGFDNVAIGHESLQTVNSNYNTAVGSKSGELTTGQLNVAVGYYAARNASTGENYTFVGAYAGGALTMTGHHNTGVGYLAMHRITSGYDNTSLGDASGQYISTGARNTTIGRLSGDSITTGNYNICLGYDAEPSSASASGDCTLGDSNISSLRCNDTSISSLSDRRDKTDIVDLPTGLNFLNTLRPVKFKWATRDGNVKDGKTRAGFIAQELQEAQTGSEYLDLVLDNNPDKLEAKQEHLIPVMVQAIKELSAEVKQLKSQLNN